MTGHPATLQLDHHQVPQERHNIHVLLLRVEVETVPGEAGDDAVELVLDDGKEDEEGELGAPEKDQRGQILKRAQC